MVIFHVILLCFVMTAFCEWIGSVLGFQSTVSIVEVCAVHNSFFGLRYLSQFLSAYNLCT
jgi:hypothetical protein